MLRASIIGIGIGTLFMAFHAALGPHSAFGWNPTAVSLTAAVAAALLSIFGHDRVHNVVRILLSVSLPLTVILTIGVIAGSRSWRSWRS
jgi:purine-cytosine permease-like protein